MSKQISYPVFISNQPKGEDLYENQSQDRIAASIVRHLNGKSGDVSLIGLDGEWGSGKSNTISLIQKKAGSRYHLFVYDTWAHQEDLQRRSFLEELTDDLFKNQLIAQEKWEEKLKTLLAKKIDSIKKTIPKLSNAIIVSFISLITLPVVKILAESEKNIWLKILYASIPLLVIVFFWAFKSIRKGEFLALEDLFYIYKEKELEEISEETISEDEPTVKKFRAWLQDLSDALSVEVIIVFDNMDRLPPEKIKSIWTLIHTFFSAASFERLNVIVPFDRKHIQKAFSEDTADNNEKTNHFINKTFSVIFNVSPGVISDWKKLFQAKFNEAFGSTEDNEFLIVRQIFNVNNESVTPRSIIAFINDLVSYKLIWDHNIALRYIALFILNKEHIAQDPVRRLLDQSYFKKCETLFGGDNTVIDNIAALFFNIEVNVASQVPLQREIEFAIRDERYEDLENYSHNPVFLTLLDQIEFSDVSLENYVRMMNRIDNEKLTAQQKLHVDNIWARVMGRQMQIKIDRLELKTFHETIIEKSPQEKQKLLIYYFVREFHSIENFTGADYYTALSSLETSGKDCEPPVDFSLMLKDKLVDPDIYIDYLEAAKDSYKKFRVVVNFEDLENFYLQSFPENVERCSSFLYLREKYTFKKLKTEVEGMLTTSSVSKDNLYMLFSLYKALSGITTQDSSMPLQKKISDPMITQLFSEIEKDSLAYEELVCMRLAKGAAFNGASAVASSALESQDAILVDAVAAKIQHYNFFGPMLLESLTSKYPLAIAVFRKLVNERKVRRLSIAKILAQFQAITDLLQVEPSSLLTMLNGWSDELPEELKKEPIDVLCPDMAIYDCCIKLDLSLSKLILSHASKYLDNKSEAEFSSAYMDADSYVFKLLIVLLNKNIIPSIPVEAFNAYKSSLQSISNADDSEYLNNIDYFKWQTLYDTSDHDHLQPIVKDIRDTFLRNKVITSAQFLFFETMLRELGAIKDYGGEFVRKIMMPLIGDNSCLNKIVENADFYMEVLDAAGNDAYGYIDTLRSYTEEQNGLPMHANLNSIIDKYFLQYVEVKNAVLTFQKSKTDTTEDVGKAVSTIVMEEGKLHFRADEVKNNLSTVPGEFILNLVWTLKGVEKSGDYDQSKWVRII